MRNEERAAMRASEQEETTAVLELPETEEKEFKFKSIFTGGENGSKKFNIRNIVIAPEMQSDTAFLAQELQNALNSALASARSTMQEKMRAIGGGLGIDIPSF